MDFEEQIIKNCQSLLLTFFGMGSSEVRVAGIASVSSFGTISIPFCFFFFDLFFLTLVILVFNFGFTKVVSRTCFIAVKKQNIIDDMGGMAKLSTVNAVYVCVCVLCALCSRFSAVSLTSGMSGTARLFKLYQ